MRVAYAGMVLADRADGVTHLVDFRAPELAKEVESVAPSGCRFAAAFDRGGAEIRFSVAVSRQFRMAEEVTDFLLRHLSDLSARRRGPLEITDFSRRPYAFSGAVLEGFAVTRHVGVALDIEYSFRASGIRPVT